MPIDTDDSLTSTVTHWLAQFEAALAGSDAAGLAALFTPAAHWRDLLALTWDVKTVSGTASVVDLLLRHGQGAVGFAIDAQRIRPRQVTRAGSQAIEAFFKFETASVRGHGVLRLTLDPGSPSYKAWTLLTAIDEIKGSEESVGIRRPHGAADSRDFSGPNWLDRRQAASAYADKDPEVLVVGGGHAGLSLAARLRQLNVDTLIIDREQRIGCRGGERGSASGMPREGNHAPRGCGDADTPDGEGEPACRKAALTQASADGDQAARGHCRAEEQDQPNDPEGRTAEPAMVRFRVEDRPEQRQADRRETRPQHQPCQKLAACGWADHAAKPAGGSRDQPRRR